MSKHRRSRRQSSSSSNCPPRKRLRLFVEVLESRNLLSGGPPDPTAGQVFDGDPDALINFGAGEFGPPAPDQGLGAPGGNTTVGLLGNEPTIAVNPANANNVIVAQFNNGTQTMKISLDGGATFPIQRNAVLPPGQSFFQGDDSLAFDAAGRLFWTYLTGSGGPNVVSLQVNPLTGAVIGTPAFVATGSLDKEWLAADHNAASPFANHLYSCWNDFNQSNAPIRFSYSTNQGSSWTTLAGNMSGAGEGFTWPSELTVAPNGDVYVAWHTNTIGNGSNGEIRMRRSTDGGLSFGAEIIPFPGGTADTQVNAGSAEYGPPVPPRINHLKSWLQGSLQPRILGDPVRPGNIYVVSVDDPDNIYDAGGDPSDIVMARSTNNGATWTRSTISHGAPGTIQIMPAAAIDASGNITVTWYDSRGGLVNASGDYLLDVYTTSSFDGGLTFGSDFRINDSSFNPDLGAPDRFGNQTLRIGEYNGLASAGGNGYAVWTGNTATGQQVIFTKFAISYQVIGSTPAQGQLVTTAPTDFIVQLNSPVDSVTVQASDLKVNSIPANSFIINGAGDTITFHYSASPVTVEGLQSMAIAAGAVGRQGDDAPVQAFSATFRYDPVPLVVSSTNPANGSVVSIPLTTLDVNFNERILPSTAGTDDLTLSAGTVTGFSVLAGNQTVEYTLSGLTTEQTLNISLANGALTDESGNPLQPYSGSLQLDITTIPYPVQPVAQQPLGSLIYDPSVSGLINFPGDTDSYTLPVDPGQTLSVLLTPTNLPTATFFGAIGDGGINAGSMIQVNPSTGTGTLMSDPVTPGGLSGLAYDPSTGVFFGSTIRNVSNISTLVRIDPNTGALLSTVGTIIDSSTLTAISIGDLAMQPGTNLLFGMRSNTDGTGNGGRLYLINKANGVATLIGNTGNPGGIAFAPNGTLYATANGSTPTLRTLNPVTGAVITSVGTLTFFDGLGVRPSDGTLFASPGGAGDQIYTINPATGVATFVGSTGVGSPSDLEFIPTGGVQPTIQLFNPSSTLIGSASAASAGKKAVLQTIPITTGGTYTITLAGAGATTGSYTMQVFLNAALEAESNDGAANNTSGTAQNLNPSFLTLQTGLTSAQRGAVIGQLSGNDDFYSFSLLAGQSASLAMTKANSSPTSPVGLFGTRADVTGFSGPISVTYGDLNGDGKQDMVTANYDVGTATVRLGNGAGGFGAASSFSLGGSNPWTLVLGDVNGDQKLDIVTSNIGSSTVSVLLGNGAGGFAGAATYSMGQSPYGVAVGDLNGDGFGDVVSADYLTNSVTVRFGSASGILSGATTYSVGGGPTAVALGDLNGDGKLDLVTANYNSGSASVLLGNGTGTLGSPNTFAMGANPFSIALGDFNGDTLLDIVTANFGSNDLSVGFGDGLGGLGAAAAYSTGGSGPVRVAVGDVNGDGTLDIVAANEASNNASVLLNSGSGAYSSPVVLASGSAPYGVALADLNSDGVLDLSTANYGAGTVSVWLNNTLQVKLQLIAPDGVTVLTTGVATANLAAAINNFVAPAPGTYFARLTGTNGASIGTSNYDLVVTRDAAFDNEPNNSFVAAQDTTVNHGALGDVAANPNQDVVVPGALVNVETNSGNAYPFNLAGFGIPSMRYQQIYSHLEFTKGGIIDALRFRRSSGQAAFTSTPIDIEITLSYAATTVASASSTFAANIGPGAVTVFDGLLTLSSTSANTSPQPFDAVIDVAGLFNYDPAQGDLLLDITVRNSPSAGFLAAPQLGQETTTTRIYDFDEDATSGTVGFTPADSRPYGLITRFDMVPPANDDWYAVNVTAAKPVLQVETSTPADGPNQFINTLNPKIELYDPSGNLVASGTPGPDGRNETIRAFTSGPGVYRIHVLAEGGTKGEYFLGVTPLQTPAVTVTVDDSSWSFHAYGPGWSTVSGGYGGTQRIHAGGGSGTSNYAQWQYSLTATAGTGYQIFATWVADPANASNATYRIYDGATLLTSVLVNQQRSPNTGVVGGSLVQSLYVYTPATSGYHVIRVQLGDNANGKIVADAVFDPPLSLGGEQNHAPWATAVSELVPTDRSKPIPLALEPTALWATLVAEMSGFVMPASPPFLAPRSPFDSPTLADSALAWVSDRPFPSIVPAPIAKEASPDWTTLDLAFAQFSPGKDSLVLPPAFDRSADDPADGNFGE